LNSLSQIKNDYLDFGYTGAKALGNPVYYLQGLAETRIGGGVYG